MSHIAYIYTITAVTGSQIFLYGRLLSSTTTLFKPLSYSIIKLSDRISCHIFELDDQHYNVLRQMLTAGTVDFTRFESRVDVQIDFSDAGVREYYASVMDIAPSFIKSRNSGLTFCEVGNALGDAAAVPSVLDILERNTRSPFTSHYAGQIGSLELITMPEWLNDDVEPIRLDHTVDQNGAGPWLTLSKRWADRTLVAMITVYSGTTVHFDKTFLLDPGQQAAGPVDFPFYNAEYMLKVYDRGTGELLYCRESGPPFLSISANLIGVMGARVIPEDKISRRIDSGGAAGGRSSRIIPETSHSSLLSSALDRDNEFAHRLYEYDGLATIMTKKGAWFENSADGTRKAAQFLKQLLDDRHITIATIADPYFNHESFDMLVRRIDHRELTVVVFTNLDEDAWHTLEQHMEQNKKEIRCTLEVTNFPNRGKQIFHDRYLFIVHGSKTTGFLLSNSINNFSLGYPFCICQLDWVTTQSVAVYLDSLRLNAQGATIWRS